MVCQVNSAVTLCSGTCSTLTSFVRGWGGGFKGLWSPETSYGQNMGWLRKKTVIIRCPWDSSVVIETPYRLYGPGIESQWGARFFAPVQTGPGTHPASTVGTGSFPGVKRSGRGIDNPPTRNYEVKEGVELYYSTFGTSWPVIGWSFPLPLLIRDPFTVRAGYIDLMGCVCLCFIASSPFNAEVESVELHLHLHLPPNIQCWINNRDICAN